MKPINRTAAYIGGFLLMCMGAGFFSATLFGNERKYEIRPEITLPEYKTEMDRVIDVYERIIDDYIKVMDKDLQQIRIELKNVSETLDAMDGSMSELSQQLETIQRKLGIDIPEKTGQPAAVPAAIENGG